MRGGGEVTATGKENRNAPMLSPPFYHFLPLRIHTHTHTARPLYTQGALQINGRMLTTFDVLHKRGHRGSHDATCNNWNPPTPLPPLPHLTSSCFTRPSGGEKKTWGALIGWGWDVKCRERQDNLSLGCKDFSALCLTGLFDPKPCQSSDRAWIWKEKVILFLFVN